MKKASSIPLFSFYTMLHVPHSYSSVFGVSPSEVAFNAIRRGAQIQVDEFSASSGSVYFNETQEYKGDKSAAELVETHGDIPLEVGRQGQRRFIQIGDGRVQVFAQGPLEGLVAVNSENDRYRELIPKSSSWGALFRSTWWSNNTLLSIAEAIEEPEPEAHEESEKESHKSAPGIWFDSGTTSNSSSSLTVTGNGWKCRTKDQLEDGKFPNNRFGDALEEQMLEQLGSATDILEESLMEYIYDQSRVQTLRRLVRNPRLSDYNRLVAFEDALEPYIENTPAVAAFALRVDFDAVGREPVHKMWDGDPAGVYEAMEKLGFTNGKKWKTLCHLDMETARYLLTCNPTAEDLRVLSLAEKPTQDLIDAIHLFRTDANEGDIYSCPDWLARLFLNADHAEEPDQIASDLRDWWTNTDVDPDKNQKRSWNWVRRQMREWHEEQQRIAEEVSRKKKKRLAAEKWPVLLQGFESKGFRFKALTNAEELREESERIGHCVGNGPLYRDRCLKGISRIFRVYCNQNNGWQHVSTCQINSDYVTDPYRATRWRLKQIRGNGPDSKNESAPEGAEEAAEKLAAAYTTAARYRAERGLQPHPEPEGTPKSGEREWNSGVFRVGNIQAREGEVIIHQHA
jgi:hypothetical protein